MQFFKSLILTFCIFSFPEQGQTDQYKALLNIALNFRGQIFINVKPLTKIRIEESDFKDNFEDYRELLKEMDTITLFQIFKNSKYLDTLNWTDAELDRFLLVQGRGEDAQLKYAIKKFNLTNKEQIKYYRKQINLFNSMDPLDRNIYSYSRPVFDDSKHFAIIEFDNGHSRLGGGGGITLYKWTGSIWKELGLLVRWRY